MTNEIPTVFGSAVIIERRIVASWRGARPMIKIRITQPGSPYIGKITWIAASN